MKFLKVLFLLLNFSFFASSFSVSCLNKVEFITEKEVNDLVENASVQFVFKKNINKFINIQCSLIYEKSIPGFALKLCGIPFYSSHYNFFPSLDQIKGIMQSQSYYYANPLLYTESKSSELTIKDICKIIKTKRCLFYTGAGISIASNVPGMDTLIDDLGIDSECKNFIMKAIKDPKSITQAFGKFYELCLQAEPTKAHYAITDIACEFAIPIVTENVDLLHQRTGIKPIFAYSSDIKNLTKEDFEEIDCILCVGLSADDRGFLAWYKDNNPNGILIALNVSDPSYLSDHDYICFGDVQETLPSLVELLK